MDESTLSLLTVFKNRSSLSLIELAAILNCDSLSLTDPVHYIMDKGYIRIGMTTESLEGNTISLHTPLEITYLGRIAINQALKDKRNFKFNEFRAWATLIIALIAFIKSFFF